jgi:hypothetical protein
MVRIPPKAAPDTAVHLGNSLAASALNRVKIVAPAFGGARYFTTAGLSVTVPAAPAGSFPKGSDKS